MIDAHFHIWRQADLPWLTGPMQPRIFGPYEPIRRDYPIARIRGRRHLRGHDRSRLCPGQLAGGPLCRGGGLRLAGFRRERLSHRRRRLCRHARRRRPAAARRPRRQPASAACACSSTGTRTRSTASPAGRISPQSRLAAPTSARLADYGWSFDLQVFSPPDGGSRRTRRRLSRGDLRSPARRHAGGPVAGRRRAWRDGMALLAASPTSSASSRDSAPSCAATIPPSRHDRPDTLALFGADRCLFGSNFPIEKLWTTYPELFAAHRAAVPEGAGTPSFQQPPSGSTGWPDTFGGNDAARDQGPRLRRHRTGIELPGARPRLRPARAPTDLWLPDPRRPLAGRRRYRLPAQPDHGEPRHARAPVPREHDREPADEIRRAHGRCPLCRAHPSAHRPRRQGRALPDEHHGDRQPARARIFRLGPDASAISGARHQAPDRPAAHARRAAASRTWSSPG
jgi:predicted TIM-barrel fold metal-dependent hydrolase